MHKILTLATLSGLAACQTIPLNHGLSAQQVAVLKDNGFAPVGDHWELGLADRMLFATDESRLLPPQMERLRHMSHQLAMVGIIGARVEGNTDSTGAVTYNMQLSRNRADNVKTALAAGGMNAAAIRAIGIGKAHPVASNATQAGRQENRRVVIIVGATDSARL